MAGDDSASSSALPFTQEQLNAALVDYLRQLGLATSTAPAVPRWEAGSIKINDPIKLRSDNYPIWRMEAEVHLINAGVWKVVDGTDPQPTTDTHDNWARKNAQARALLMQLVTEDFKPIIGNNPSASTAWTLLEDTLDRKNVTSTIHPVNTLFDYKKDEAKSWQEHVSEFESLLTIVNSKVATADSSSKPWLQGLKQCFADDEFKAHLLLRTLPRSCGNIVDNLRTKTDLSYTDTRTHVLDLSSDSATAGSALISHGQQKKMKKKSSDKKKSSSSSSSSTTRPGIPPSDECSYCWKRQLPSKNHTHSACLVLKKALEDKKSGSAKIAAGMKDDINRGFALISSSHLISTNPPLQPPLRFQAMNFDMNSGRALISAQNKSSEVWTFDTAASHHITADFSLLQDPTPISFHIEIGDGRFLKATYQGKVKFDIMEGDSVIPLTLSDVLYILDWGSSSLVSWHYIASKCRMAGEDDWITVSLKNGTRLFSARSIGPNLYNLPVHVHRGKAYLSLVQF